MSRMYRVNVKIENSGSGREPAIAEALLDFWGFEDVIPTGNELTSDADGNLVGGQSEEEFARELTQLIWSVNQGFCKVAVNMTYLEVLPSEEYEFASQSEYDAWVKTSNHSSSAAP